MWFVMCCFIVKCGVFWLSSMGALVCKGLMGFLGRIAVIFDVVGMGENGVVSGFCRSGYRSDFLGVWGGFEKI